MPIQPIKGGVVKLNAIGILICILAAVHPVIALAQEDLDAILDRGYPSQWYVVGPFESDLDEGIVSAIANEQRALGRNDFMASVGGVLNLQPSTGLRVQKPNGSSATWIRIREEDSTLDLSPFFTDAEAGIAFAAFQSETPSPRTVLFELHSLLGARVFLNGEEIRETPAGPIGVIGVDQFVAQFRTGSNVFILQVPGANPTQLEEAINGSLQDVTQNRTHLDVNTGYEFDLRVQAVEPLGDLYYAPRLQEIGTFSGAGTAIAQDAWLTVFNPNSLASPEIQFSGRSAYSAQPLTASIPAIPANTLTRTRIPVPVSRATPGQVVTVQARIAAEANSEQWVATITAESPPKSAEIFIAHMLSEPMIEHPSLHEQVAHKLDVIQRTLKHAESNPDVGMHLGTTRDWWDALTHFPESRPMLETLRNRRQLAAQRGYINLDYRIADAETMMRNWQFGNGHATTWLEAATQSLWAWNAPYLPSQTAQLANDAGIPGVIHNINANGLPALYHQLSPDGSTNLHRRKSNTPQLRSLLDLYQSSRAQHRDWENAAIRSDLLVYENVRNAPEPFWSDTSIPLTDAVPSLIPTGDAADRYFSALRQERSYLNRPQSMTSRPIRDDSNLRVLMNPELQSLLADLQSDLRTAELFATLATTRGLEYPHLEFEHAWNSVLYFSEIDRLTTSVNEDRLYDYLGVFRETRDAVSHLSTYALQSLAENITTTGELVPDTATAALVVFNPSNWIRSDIVEAVVQMDGTSGMNLLDSDGEAVEFEVLDFAVESNRLMSVHIRFLATNVPGLSHKTWYVTPTGGLPQATKVFTPFIENEFYRVEFENGSIKTIDPRIEALPTLDNLEFNEVVAYPVDWRDDTLAWSGETIRSNNSATTVSMENSPLGQQAILESPFAGGTLKRTVTLNRGVPWIEVDIEITGVSRTDYVFASEFTSMPSASIPILGEPFGSITGIRDPRPVVLSDDTPQLPASNFSQRFHAAGTEAGIDVRDTGFTPFESALIIHPGDVRSSESATHLQRALLHHHIPAAEFAYDELDERPVWQDDTLPITFHDDYDVGTSFIVLIGNAESNPYTESMLTQLDASTRPLVEGHIDAGRPVFMVNRDVPFGVEPIPTLILAGDTSAHTSELVKSTANELRNTGTLVLEADQTTSASLPQRPEWGVALFHRTPSASNLTADKLTHYLYTPEKIDSNTLASTPLKFQFALKPYAGRLRNSNITRLSHAYTQPLVATQTTLHEGDEPSLDSYLEIDAPNLVVTGLHPVIPTERSFTTEPSAPETIALRLYETTGLETDATIQTAFAPYGFAQLTPFDTISGAISTVTNNIQTRFTPFDIQTLGFYLPPNRNRRSMPSKVDLTSGPSHVFARPWQANHMPTSLLDRALTLRIQETLPAIDGRVEVVVSNNSLDQYFDGNVTVRVAAGWTVTPRSNNYSLAPQEYETLAFTATRENNELSDWGMVAQTAVGDRITFDARSTDDYPIEVFSERQDNEYLVTIRNRGGLPVLGDARLLSSFDVLPEGYRSPFTPEHDIFTIEPYRDKRILFTRNSDQLPDWITAKIFANGTLIYHDVRLDESTHAN